ncbi:UDP-N-acetylmuramoylalanyl-D-glutamate--2,6-diaminopimelate ligase [Paraoerskovia marina]|uniref:UDP-N-acetylmuramyl-tripeptide synthetase n=1 Tax=Paraoerskovia marina TaxID=545619 RepID=A0A1H1TRQ5_9CELL|nr:UDP-N-acetylmuramoyl-L-alanyl-D-glutamate--2,6-diaminopimelate ligase [Paraoerskovia marina]SDS62626.1 UDP-N-acetylmuramoylalanyl-D-glutamate--2,6-diaminopimelate ligase [Paraoerskovia marina]
MSSPIDRLRPAVSAGRPLRDVVALLDLEPDSSARLDVPVTSVSSDNRTVQPQALFVALPGAHVHGATYAEDAVSRGAVAVLTDPAGRELLREISVPVVVCDEPRTVLGPVASVVYGAPAQDLGTFAVTGTNGKTTTTYMIDHVLGAMGFRGGLVGTVETRSGDRVLPSRLTTPEAADLQALLAAMREDDVRTLAMEVSSHALALHRVDGIVFDVAGFTNLSQDHLDFHGDLQGYFATKARLFTPAHARRGVVVVDDAWGERMVESAQIPVATLRTTAGQGTGSTADWWVDDVHPEPGRTAFTLRHRDGRALETGTSLPGGFNVTNAALALAMVLEAGSDVRDVADALGAAGGVSPAVPGRMEQVSDEPRVVVDFAHNPDALRLALQALRPTTRGRLTVVFGATGERDVGKRPTMGAIAVEYADRVVVTDDDPHAEAPGPIRAQVLAGARSAAERVDLGEPRRGVAVDEVAPRAEAIATAIREAGEHDTVLVAGRGHETVQEIAGVDHLLDDRVEARAAVAARKPLDNDMKEQHP